MKDLASAVRMPMVDGLTVRVNIIKFAQSVVICRIDLVRGIESGFIRDVVINDMDSDGGVMHQIYWE